MVSTLFLLLSLSMVDGSRWLRLTPEGAYSRVTVRIEEQPQPEDCQHLLDQIKVSLNETSLGLHSLSQGRTFFSDVQVSIPNSWTKCEVQIDDSVPDEDPDFLVGNAFGGPWAEQPGGCGQSGTRIHVPKDFFVSGNKSKSLLREWCKYRYGVFPETGFSDGDRLYPHSYTEGNATKVNQGCDEDVRKPFCPLGQPYDRRAPTKQNLLCHETSAIETILAHEDLNKNNGTAQSAPVITFTRRPLKRRLRLVLALDRTAAMAVNGRWTHVKRALFRLLQRLPVGAEVSAITFGKEATLNLPPTVVTDENREGLHGRIPRKPLEDELACVYCAMNLSLKTLGQAGGEVILLTGSPRRPQLLDRLVGQIERDSVRVFPVILPGTAHPDINQLAKNGRVYAVPEDGGEMNSLEYLTEVMLDVLNTAGGVRTHKLHSSRHSSREFAGTFTLHPSLRSRMSVTLSVQDENSVEFFEVTDPAGHKRLFSRFEDGMVIYDGAEKAQPGIWTFHAKMYNAGESGRSGARATVDVISEATDESAQPCLLDVFVSSNNVVDAYRDPVVIFARLTQGSMLPVIGAKVTARIFGPGGGEPIELTLRDDGAGDPDVTAGDGIYSVHFVKFSSVPGFYSLEVSATDHQGLARTVKQDQQSETEQKDVDCCGSRFPHRSTIPCAPFKRRVAGPAFYVRQGVSPKSDLAPPGRVLDFRLAKLIPDSLYAQFEWTAPGGDFDLGRAASYEIRCHTSRRVLSSLSSFRESGILVHASFTPAPQPRGHKQTCTVGVPWPNEVFYYALVAIDDAENAGQISNIVSLYIPETQATTTTEATSAQSIIATRNTDDNALTTEKATGLLQPPRRLYYMVAAAATALVLLAAAVVSVILVRARIKRAEYDADHRDTYREYEPPLKEEPPQSSPAAGAATTSESARGLSSWLESLPDAATVAAAAAAASGDSVSNHARVHAVTKTNPYRHKVLTNGSFLNLKDATEDGGSSSSRPTTSTEDNNSSQSSESEPADCLLNVRTLPQPQRPLIIDTSTARAIIDTYSGNLFSGGGSFRGDLRVRPPAEGTDFYCYGYATTQRPRTESVV